MPKKILLADDSLTIQKVVELTFSDSDYELFCVSNGQKALDRIRDDRPDLVLADVVMPEKNGYEVCEALKSNPATARIPVMLLSGTFEPFDRDRAERIGADSIVSKPFDSQQLIAQVEALLDRSHATGAPEAAAATTGKMPVVENRERPAPAAVAHEEPPFDVGFSAEDFTAAVRVPSRGLDPFEEEYGRGDVDSAIAAFEKARPQATGPDVASSVSSSAAPEPVPQEESREPLSQWLAEEPEKAQESAPTASADMTPKPEGRVFDLDAETTVAIAGPLPVPSVGLEEPPVPAPSVGLEELSAEMPPQTVALRIPSEESGEAALPGAPEFEAEEESPRATMEPPTPAAETVPALEPVVAAEVPHEIEMLAQTSSIPELTQMLSSVARSAGGDLTDEQIEKLARRVVEKLSDRIVREIAWEVIPDMAEIVIKQRIKELEAGVE